MSDNPLKTNMFKLGSVTSVADCRRLAEMATEAANLYNQANQDAQRRIAVEKSKVDAQLASADSHTRNKLRPILEEQFKERRKQILKDADKVLWAPVAHLKEMAERATAGEDLVKNPVSLLTAVPFSDKRSRVFQEAQYLGKAALKGLAQRAASEGDFEAAAALLTANDARPVADRAFSSSELAESLMGDKSKEATNLLKIVHASYSRSLDAQRQLINDRGPTGVERLKDHFAFNDVKPLGSEAA